MDSSGKDGDKEGREDSDHLPGLGSDGFNDPIFMPRPTPAAGKRAASSKSESESEASTSAESTPNGSPSRPPKGRTAGSPAAAGGDDAQGAIAARARRRDFYSKTAKGFIIPREDIPGSAVDAAHHKSQKHVSKSIEEGILGIGSPKQGRDRAEGGAMGEGFALPPVLEDSGAVANQEKGHLSSADGKRRSMPGKDEDEWPDENFGLFLRVASSDIRQDETGPPYQVYVVDAFYGRKKWQMERTLGDFCALGQRLQSKMDPKALPTAPQAGKGGWLLGLTGGGDAREDRHQTTKHLDSYIVALAECQRNMERQVSSAKGDADAEGLMHLVHCLYEFADFVEGSGSYLSRLALLDSSPMDEEEEPDTEGVDSVIQMPTTFDGDEDENIETLLVASLELQRLQVLRV